MSETLKPCPFCGGEGFVADLEGDGWVAGCNAGQERAEDDQGCRESAIGFYADTREEAIAAWNRRAPASDAGTGPRETQGERERLAEELDYDVVPALFARASEAFYREHDVAAWRRRAEAVEAAARLLRSAPPREPARCHTCGNPATKGEAPYEDATDEELVLAYGRAVVSYQRQHDGAVDWPGSKAIDRLRTTRADLLRALSEGPKRRLIAAGRRIAEEVERARAESLQHSGQEPAK